MQKILNELNMNIKQFSEHYEIPYNTVRQWVNGTRTPPSYVIKLLNEKIEREKKGEQTILPTNKTYYVIEVELSTKTFIKIYEKDSILYKADKNFWEGEEKKQLKYPPKVRCFEVMEI